MTPRALLFWSSLLLAASPASAEESYPKVTQAWSCEAQFAAVRASGPLVAPFTPAQAAEKAEITATAEATKISPEVVENIYAVPANLTAKQTAARARLAELEAKPVSEIYPSVITRNGKQRVAMGSAEREKMHAYFKQLWDARVEGGILPRMEVKKYQNWLRKQSPDMVGYPEIDAAQLYTDYVQTGQPMSRYFDDKFLDYIEKDHGLTHETLPDYLGTLEPEYLKYYTRVRFRDLRRIRGTLKNSAVAAPVTGLSMALVGWWSGAFKQGIDSGRQYLWSGVQQGEDLINRSISAQHLQDNVDKLGIASQQLAQAKMGAGVSRETEVAAIQTTQAGLAALAPATLDAVLSNQPDFLTNWRARLDKDYLPMTSWQATYSQLSQSLEDLRSRLDRMAENGQEPSGSDLRRLAQITSQMSSFEDQMANVMADYLFYRGFKTKDPAADLARQYDPVVKFYMENMDIAKLRDQLASRIADHALLVKGLVPPFTDSEKSFISKSLEARKQADKAKADLQRQKEVAAEAHAKKVIEEKQADANAVVGPPAPILPAKDPAPGAAAKPGSP